MSRMSRIAAAAATVCALAAPVAAQAASHTRFVDHQAAMVGGQAAPGHHVRAAHKTAAGQRTGKTAVVKRATAKARRGIGPCAGANLMLSPKRMGEARRAVLCLLNRQRAHHGLRPLAANAALARAARNHSLDMVRHRYFEHGAFVSRIVRAGYLNGYRSYAVGENIAWGAGTSQTPAVMVREWMHSPPHRANILSRSYHQIGVGIALGTPTGYAGGTYTTDFGSRR